MIPVFYALKKSVLARGLLRSDQRVLMMISAGVDSVFLFHFLLAFLENPAEQMHLFYADHGLRPEATPHERLCVLEYAHRFGIKASIRRIPTQLDSFRFKRSIETSGRIWRRKMALHLARLQGCSVVVSAHHLNDTCESFLMQLCRGAKGGLSGIRDVSWLSDTVQLVRPMGGISKSEIYSVANDQGWRYCEDDSNRDLCFTRNRVRHEIFPVISRVMPAFEKQWGEVATYLGEVDDFLQLCITPTLDHIESREDGLWLARSHLQSLHAVLQRRVLFYMMKTKVSREDSDKHVVSVHVDQAAALLIKGQGELDLPNGFKCRVTRDWVWVGLDPANRMN